ncbi:MAG TPA: hypothetical protein VJ809_00385, partial [Pirellulales bacterium]|nr:hypothetical protein [Pirellulales bacterium]
MRRWNEWKKPKVKCLTTAPAIAGRQPVGFSAVFRVILPDSAAIATERSAGVGFRATISQPVFMSL